MNHHTHHCLYVEPLSSGDSVVIGLDLDFMLENPIILIPMCYKYVFGTLAHILCLSYMGVTVFGTKKKSVRKLLWERAETENYGFWVGKPHWIAAAQQMAGCCMHKKFMVNVTCSLKVPTQHYPARLL